MESIISLPAGVQQERVCWLPCKITSNCTGASLDYTERSSAPESGDTIQEATLRGRQLQGQVLQLPEGYSGYVTEQQGDQIGSEDDHDGSAGAAPAKRWAAVASFSQLTYFNHDTAPSRMDAPRRCLDWLQVAQQIHAPVSPEEVRAQAAAAAAKQ